MARIWYLNPIFADLEGKNAFKVQKILRGSLDLIPLPSLSVKIQIIGGKVCLRCKGKTLLGVVNKTYENKNFVESTSNVLPYYLQ